MRIIQYWRKGKTGQWYWHFLETRNGEITANGEGHPSHSGVKVAAKANVRAIVRGGAARGGVATAVFVDQFNKEKQTGVITWVVGCA